MKILEKIIEYGLYLFVFLLPWQTRLILNEGNLNGYWEYGTISLYTTEVLLWVIFILAAIWWAIYKLKNQKSRIQISNKIQKPKSRSDYLLICLSAFLLYSFISIFGADSKSVALQAWVRLVEGIGFFLVLRTVKFDVAKLIWSFVFSAVLQVGLGFWQFLSQSTFSFKWLGMAFHDPAVPGTVVVETTLRRWLRAYGGLPHPNMLASFLAVAMFFVFWIYQKTEQSLRKLLLPLIFAILSIGLCSTFSKSVVLSFLMALILLWAGFFVFKQSKESKLNLLKFTLIFLVIAAVFSAIFWEPVQTRIYGAERLEIKSTTERLNYFGEAWQLIKNHPLTGVGLGNYTLSIHNDINPDLQSWSYQPVHNIYLLILAELGIIGFILWLVLIFLLIKKIPITNYQLPITLLVISLFDHYLWTLYFGIILFWLVLGVGQKALDNSFDKT